MRESARRPRRRKRNIGVFARARGEIRAAINSEPWGHRLARAQERARGKEAKWPTGQALNKRRERLNKSKLVLPRQPRESRDSRYPRSLSLSLSSSFLLCLLSLSARFPLSCARERVGTLWERNSLSDQDRAASFAGLNPGEQGSAYMIVYSISRGLPIIEIYIYECRRMGVTWFRRFRGSFIYASVRI